jgi:hypothetical protein
VKLELLGVPTKESAERETMRTGLRARTLKWRGNPASAYGECLHHYFGIQSGRVLDVELLVFSVHVCIKQ